MKLLLFLCFFAFFITASACQPATPSGPKGTNAAQSAARVPTGAATATGVGAATTISDDASLDSVRKGMAYADFRAALMGDGWKPLVDSQCKANVVGANYRALCNKGLDSCKACDELPELSACSGDAICLMRFRDAQTQRQLDVSTYGNIADRAVHGTASQLNVTGWTVSPASSR